MSRERKLPPYSDDEIAADPDLAAALLSDAESLLAIEQQMKALREQKADLFDDLRQSRFKPEFAKAWVATQMVDEEKDAARAEKEMVLARVVSAMDAVKGAKARARAGVRPREEKPAPRQAEKFDPATGEVHEVTGAGGATSPDTSEDGPTREDGLAAPVMLASEIEKAEAVQPDCPAPEADRVFASMDAAVLDGRTTIIQQPYRIDAPTAPKPPVEDLDLPAGLRREPVRSAAE